MTPKQEIALLSTANLVVTGALVATNHPQYAVLVGSVLGAATIAVGAHAAGKSWGESIVAALASLKAEGVVPTPVADEGKKS